MQAGTRLFDNVDKKMMLLCQTRGAQVSCFLLHWAMTYFILFSVLLFCSWLGFLCFCERLGWERWISIRVWCSCKSGDRKDAPLTSAMGWWRLEADGLQLGPCVHRPALVCPYNNPVVSNLHHDHSTHGAAGLRQGGSETLQHQMITLELSIVPVGTIVI